MYNNMTYFYTFIIFINSLLYKYFFKILLKFWEIFTLIIIYKLIDYFSDKISLRDYTYSGSNPETLSDIIQLNWYNSSDKNKQLENKKPIINDNVYYRFKVEVQIFKTTITLTKLIFLNKRTISILAKLKLLLWFIKESFFIWIYKKDKNYNRKKELPVFFLKEYIFPLITQSEYNYDQSLYRI